MKIYAACLASYNNGTLYGKWIDVVGEWSDEISDQIQNMIDASPTPGAEEYAIHDYDNLPDFGEHPDLQAISDYCRLVEEYDHLGEDGVRAIVDNCNGNVDQASKDCENAVCYSSFQDYADELADEMLHGVGQNIASYFDYEAHARDLRHDYIVIEIDGRHTIITH